MQLRILFVEDSLDDVELCIRELKRGGYEVEYQRVETAEAMQATIEHQAWDVIICDYVMPQFSPHQALETLKAIGQDLPFIVVSGTIGEETAVSVLKAGAHDFLIKGKFARLVPAIQRELKDAEVRRERKRTEEKLRESEERYRTLIEQASDGIFIADPQGNYIDANPSGCAMLGYSHEEILKLTLRDVVDPDELDARPLRLKELQEGKTLLVERKLLRKNGSTFFAELSAKALPHGYYQAIVRDITERKRGEQAEEKLRESEERYRRFFENMHETFIIQEVIVDDVGKPIDLQYLDLNPAAERILGKTRNEIIGKTRSQLSGRPDLEGVEMASQVAFTGTPFHMIRHSPGFGGWFESFTYSLGSGIVATLSLNITERKQAEEALRQSQENFVKAFNSNPAAIAITRLADGKFLNLNPAYARIMEYEPHELLDHTAAEMNIYVHPEERDSLIQQLREHGTVQNYELVVRIKSGEMRNIVISMEPILYNEQECILTVFIDISERKKMEQELQRSNAELAQFAYIASHDLQEPLRAVAGMVQLLRQRYQGKLDARADEYIDLAVDASTRMQKLINDLLAYSRVDRHGKSFESINAEALLNIALANLQVAIQESNVTVTHDALPTVFSDSSQLTQVFQNLIGNAIKFRGARQLQIHIGVQEMDNTWRFAVRDNGIGIEPQYYERIFLVFQRLHTRREYPGTGIGLSLCKKIVERHGGRIWVESEPGQGPTFYFTIPQRQ